MSKLYVIFREKDFNKVKDKIQKEDFILLKEKNFNILNKIQNKNIFISTDANIDDKKLNYFAIYFKRKFSDFSDYKYINNYFSNIFIPFYKLYLSIKQLLREYSITEIVLVGGNKKLFFIPYYFAEGEVQKQIFYKSNWFFNAYLYQIFNKKIKVNILYEESYFKIKFFIFLRQHVLLHVKFLIILFKLIKWKRSNIKIDFNKEYIIFPVRSIAQVNSLKNLFFEIKKDNELPEPIFLAYELLFNKTADTYNFLKKNNLNFIYINDLRLFNVLKNLIVVYFKTYKKILSRRIVFESKFMELEKILYEVLLKDKIKLFNNNSFLISSEIQSPEMFIEKNIAQKYLKIYFNLQTQSMSLNPLPDLNYNSFFVIENKLTFNYYKQFKQHKNIKFLGSFKYLNIKSFENKGLDKSKILFLTQPHELELQIEILKNIKNILKNKKIFIKKHPRDFFDYRDIVDNKIVFIEEENNISVLMQKYDIVVSRTTSLILDFLLNQKLVFSILISEFDINDKHVYINEKYLNIISHIDQIFKIRNFIDKYDVKKHEEKYNNLVNDFYGQENFIENLKKIYNEKN